MKRVLFISLFSAVGLTAIGQGRVTLCNDTGSLYTFLGSFSTLSGPIPTSGPLPGGIVLAVGLYGGTSSSTLTLQKKVLLNPPGGTGMPDGRIPNMPVICSFPGGSVAYFQVVVWDSAYPDPDASWRNSYIQGNNNIFTMIPGTGFLQPPLITTGSNTTWTAVGNENPLSVFVASRVPIQSVAVSNGNFVLSWNTFGFPLYWVQYKTNLAQSDWMAVPGDPIGPQGNVVFSFADPIQTGGPQRFYRVLWLPF